MNGYNQSGFRDINSDGFMDLLLAFDKPSLRSILQDNSNLIIDDAQLYLFDKNTQLESNFFFGSE